MEIAQLDAQCTREAIDARRDIGVNRVASLKEGKAWVMPGGSGRLDTK